MLRWAGFGANAEMRAELTLQTTEIADHRHCPLLRPRGERPYRRIPEPRDELRRRIRDLPG
jgi:hypothetical protein